MRSPERVIAQAIRFDNRLTDNAERILAALDAEGYEIVPRQPPTAHVIPIHGLRPTRLVEIARTYAEG